MAENECEGCLCESCKNKNTDKCIHTYDVCRECFACEGYYFRTTYCSKRETKDGRED